MMKPPSRELEGLLQTRAQLIEHGLTDNQIARQVRAGQLHHVRWGAYVAGSLWDELDETNRHRLLSRAVLTRAEPRTVLTHVSSVAEFDVPIWDLDLRVVHTTRTDGRSGRRISDWAQHKGTLPKKHVMVVNGVHVSSPTRAALEITTITDVEHALVVVNAMLHAGLTTKKKLRRMAKRLRHWPNSLTMDLVLRLADKRIGGSVGETRTFHMLWKHGVRKPEPQVDVYDENGEHLGRVDFLFEEEGVFLEFDGKVKYEKYRREGESLEDYVRREKLREERICAATGWVCIRITWADLSRPQQTVARVRRLLASRNAQQAS